MAAPGLKQQIDAILHSDNVAVLPDEDGLFEFRFLVSEEFLRIGASKCYLAARLRDLVLEKLT